TSSQHPHLQPRLPRRSLSRHLGSHCQRNAHGHHRVVVRSIRRRLRTIRTPHERLALLQQPRAGKQERRRRQHRRQILQHPRTRRRRRQPTRLAFLVVHSHVSVGHRQVCQNFVAVVVPFHRHQCLVVLSRQDRHSRRQLCWGHMASQFRGLRARRPRDHLRTRIVPVASSSRRIHTHDVLLVPFRRQEVQQPPAVLLREDRRWLLQPLLDRLHIENAVARRQEAALRILGILLFRAPPEVRPDLPAKRNLFRRQPVLGHQLHLVLGKLNNRRLPLVFRLPPPRKKVPRVAHLLRSLPLLVEATARPIRR